MHPARNLGTFLRSKKRSNGLNVLSGRGSIQCGLRWKTCKCPVFGAMAGITCAALAPLPWCGWLAFTAAQPVWNSVAGLESFPETFNPGYFAIKAALYALVVSLVWQCVRELRAACRSP